MTRILSVSYDHALLSSRQLLLESLGYQVVSAGSFNEGVQECNRAAAFDLFVLGHSIPRVEKEALVASFRAHSRAPIIALKKFGEEATTADFQIDPDPSQLLDVVYKVVSRNAASA